MPLPYVRPCILSIFFSLVLFACAPARHHHEGNAAPAGEDYTSLSEDGAWCWFSDPGAIQRSAVCRPRPFGGLVKCSLDEHKEVCSLFGLSGKSKMSIVKDGKSGEW